MANKFHSDIQEKIENLYYGPGLQDTGDLEVATRAITSTSEASGIGNADYSKSLTLIKPGDARLIVMRIAARLAVTIDSFDTATHLYCRVYVDAQDADHRLFDEDWSNIGAKLDATNKDSGTLFDLITDGAAHTFYFFFWVDQGNNAVISLVQLWECVGISGTSWLEFLRLDHQGLVSFTPYGGPLGSGALILRLASAVTGNPAVNFIWTGDGQGTGCPLALIKTGSIRASGTVATDLSCLISVELVLRSRL